MRLTPRRLNRTLLLRQHLLERVAASPEDEVRHLVGLQAQEGMSPYLSLHARLGGLDPHAVSAALDERRLVRLTTLRGTVHLLAPEDAGPLRAWAQPRVEQELRANQAVQPARDLDRDAFTAALLAALADGPRPQRILGERLAEDFAGVPPAALGQLARLALPLVQTPPRGCWKRSGGVVYQHLDTWLGAVSAPPDVPRIVRRYLAAYGPATAADVTAWSGVTRLGPVLAAMADLERHQDEQGRTLYDVPGAALAEEDTPAPVRLLGRYDNLWLSHAERDRVTRPDQRARWMGVNGGVDNVLFADGQLEGLWRVEDDRVRVLETFRPLTAAEQEDLATETTRVEELLAT